MVTENFKTIQELFQHVMPALKSKVKELKSYKIVFITEKDVWEFLKNTKWYREVDLTLFDIVNDILLVNEKEILHYISTKRKKEEAMETIQNIIEEDTIL